MNIIRTDLSLAARAGALDPNLAFSQVFEQHRTLVNQTASSSLGGMLNVISQTGLYARGIQALQKASQDQERAQVEAAKNPLKAAEPSSTATITAITDTGRREGAQSAARFLDNLPEHINNIRNGLPSPSQERSLADQVHFFTFWTRDDGFQVANGNLSKLATIRSNYDSLISLRNQIQSLLDSIPNTQQNAARRSSIQNLLNNTNHVINSAGPLRNFVDSNIIRIQNIPPSTTDLGNGYLLSTYGNTGVTALMDPSGHQILIGADGTVDDLRNTMHNRWQFNSTTTFVLPGETKLTFNPGNPASLLVSRGIHAMTIDNLGPNRSPQTSDYTSLNGRIMDRDSNDGYLVYPSGGLRWSLDGNALGFFNSRQGVAFIQRVTELRLDPTDINLSTEVAELRAFLGINEVDYDGDGRFNDEEIALIQIVFADHVRNLEVAYNEALSRITAANAALMELTEMLDDMRRQAEKQTDAGQAQSAEDRALMRSIEQRLNSALALLRGDAGSPVVPSGGIESNANLVLEQLNQISRPDSSLVLPPTSSPPSPSSPPPVGDPPSGTGSGSDSSPGGPPLDPLGESMRRASRLISGLSTNLRFLEAPPTITNSSSPSGPSPVTNTPLEGSPPVSELRETIEQLAGLLAGLLGQTTPDVQSSGPGMVPPSVSPTPGGALVGDVGQTPPPTEPPLGTVGVGGPSGISSSTLTDPLSTQTQDIAIGLQELLGALADAGVIDLSGLPLNQGPAAFFLALLQSLGTDPSPVEGLPVSGLPSTTSPPTVPGGVPNLPALLSFLGILAQFGSANRAVAPQTANTTPGQVELAGAGSLNPLSRNEQNINDRLAPQGRRGETSRTNEQVAQLLSGLAALGTPGVERPSGDLSAPPPSSSDLRLGLSAFLTALSNLGLFATTPGGSNQSPSSPPIGLPSVSSNPTPQSPTDSQEGRTTSITSNFYTDPELLKQLRANLEKALQTYREQLDRATTLFGESQQTVQKFVNLIEQDQVVQELIQSDELSDEQQDLFADKMKEMRQDLGLEWGGNGTTASSQSEMVSRAVRSGMMV